MALELEIKTYDDKLQSELLAHEGKFVVIHRDAVVGYADTYADALRLGYDKFDLDPFLVKQIQAVEQVQFVARM